MPFSISVFHVVSLVKCYFRKHIQWKSEKYITGSNLYAHISNRVVHFLAELPYYTWHVSKKKTAIIALVISGYDTTTEHDY